LEELDIPILGEHTGDHVGRSMKFDLEKQTIQVRTANREYIDL
jgi:chemotaxis receptor (MCP) glutamine deamidase CheD